MKNLELILAKHPFFQNIPEENIRSIAGLAKIVQFMEGDVLFKEGGDADKFYLIIKGKVALETFAPGKGAVTLQTVEDGEMLGWSWLVAPYKYRFGARVITKTEMIVINGEELRLLCEKDPVLGYKMMKSMLQAITFRLEQTRLLVMDVYANRANKK
jgi:CRP-like cAMP-binding protein